jgi:hypothetical protein
LASKLANSVDDTAFKKKSLNIQDKFYDIAFLSAPTKLPDSGGYVSSVHDTIGVE